ncbi:phage baseplate assembly protein V [Streptomyces lydicus]|uniref:phage baseplate assembly protein V n=1 Tax=Streptomyces lydicus TaxID=47763 RepID=UPI000524FA8B|nr:phage baseplate assembly protein V [Streptomyces lydicus]MDC7341110.1 phage baseplate assembly protein V [Streptomyces lydicus]UEG89208.1 phage baseplate assembly protein V [Streptomyces lydicus]
MTRFYGKYRGKVTANTDPLMRGRVQVSVPAVLGTGRLSWAEPCVPYAGPDVGLFAVPPTGANVWVEFEAGDPDRPILAGCFWGTGEAPAAGALPGVKMWKTEAVTVTLSDLPGGGFTIEVGPPAAAVPVRISCTGEGLELSAGPADVKLSGPTVSVNNGALEVT